ncbi:MAG TPA: SulP family inorganic anion transporter [Acidimicrobiales bacterium]|nr:SulP family inorganic anion transporter [Acidimicrobiales bacterium]
MPEFPKRLRALSNRDTLSKDAVAGVVLGGQSVPDGLAGGLLAGVNPVFGLYGYLFGMLGAAFFTGSQFMTVQATGAMAAVVSDVDAVHGGDDPETALFTLAVLTGVVMLVAGIVKLGSILRFVSNAVMVGFISGVGVNIVLGQLDDFTGYESQGANRLAKALDLLLHPLEVDLRSIVVGVVTIALIVTLERTRLGALSLVVAVVVGSSLVPMFGWNVAQLSDIVSIPDGLPGPRLPQLGLIPTLIVPAIALAFVGLVQGAAITANFPNPDGTYPDASHDFIGQGVGNLVSGTFQGMPVGGSMSATSIVTAAGSQTRVAQIVASGVMAITIIMLGGIVDETAMPALAGLLIVVGFRTVKPDNIVGVWKTGQVQAATMTVTLVLTILIPLQFAVLAGVGLSTILFVIRQSNDLVVKRLLFEDGGVREVEPPATVSPNEVVLIQPYGSLFFASASAFEDQIPDVTADTRHSVVIVRLRGRTDLGSTLSETLARYAADLAAADSRLLLISDDERVLDQLEVAGVTALLGEGNLYRSDEWLGRTMRRAHDDAVEWIASRSS